MMARLKPGVTIEGAQSQLESISPAIFAAHVSPRYTPDMAKDFMQFSFTVTAAHNGVSGLRRTYQTQLWVLLGVTGLVLLITCANLANLLLARATAREREMALRLAIGATRRRLVKQLLSEGLLISGLGAAGGVVVARWLSQSLVAFLNTQNARLFVDLSPDWRLFAFIVAVAVVACVLFGLSPALKASHTSPGHAMQAGGRSNTDSRERFNVRRALVVVQVGLSMVLIVGALLLSRSLRNLVTLDLGFRQNGIIAIDVDTRQSALSAETRSAAYAQLMERVRAVPGVDSASEASVVPMSGSVWNQPVLIDGQKKDGLVYFNEVGIDYFRTMQTRLIAGRPFGREDRVGSTPTVIVNESFARKYFPGQSPIGRTFSLEAAPGRPQPQYQIIGLVKDAKYTDLREDFKPIGYFAAAQDDDPGPSLDLVVHSSLSLATLNPALTRTIREVVPNATVVYNTIDTYVRDSLVTERLMAWLSGFFGLLGMVIATMGLYGVISYTVSRRKTDIGIRIALGADSRRVVWTVLSESAVLLAVGLVIGTVLALLAARWATSLLFGLTSWDPLSYAAAITALFAVGVIAAWIPARRASRVAPTVALRAE
jgi:putative ABC transport system permease protein